jgi:hypothetical protein
MTTESGITLSKALTPVHSRETLRLWRRMEMAWRGGEAFKRQYLWRHEREDEEDWVQRLRRAVYENHLRDLVNRREAIIFGRRISRSVQSSSLPWAAVSGNIDGNNNSWDAFIRSCFTHSQLFGFAAVLVDIPTAENLTAMEDELGNIRPFVRLLHPQRLINWSLADDGSFQWVVVQDNDAPVRKQLITPETIYTFGGSSDDADRETDGRPRPRSMGDNPSGTVPIVILSDLEAGGESLGLPSLQSACDLSILYFNQSNWYDQLLYKTNYSTLAATPFGGSHEEDEMVAGSGDVFWVPEGGMIPAWISPDTGPADVFERRLAYMRRRMYELAALDVGHVEDKTRDLSGMAYSVRRLPTEEMAMRLARKLKEFEERLIRTIYQCAGHRVSAQVKYPARYGVRPLSDAMREIEIIEKSRLLPEEIKTYIASQIIFTEGFADLSDDKQREFETLIRQKTLGTNGEQNV